MSGSGAVSGAKYGAARSARRVVERGARSVSVRQYVYYVFSDFQKCDFFPLRFFSNDASKSRKSRQQKFSPESFELTVVKMNKQLYISVSPKNTTGVYIFRPHISKQLAFKTKYLARL